jgi:ATP-dependent DNA helicase RecG
VRSRRYRNRRLGEFLKELKLTEGRATGIPTILKTLKENGSASPRFNTDADRTFFEVELFVHPAFVEKEPLKLDIHQIVWTLNSINQVVDAVIEHTVETDDVEAISDIAKRAKDVSFQAHRAIKAIEEEESSDMVGDIAKGIDSVIASGDKGILELCNTPKYRTDLFDYLQLAKHPTNYKVHIDPLISLNWLTMTIPNKPTSPNQQYLTTLKGRVILELLKYLK